MQVRLGENVAVIALCAAALALAFALPQLDRPFWHDEVATLELFAASGPLYPFTDYHIPNNHPLSSAVLALMRPVSEAPAWLRLWPLAATLSACLLLVVLAWRLGGAPAAWLAGVAFACSGITQAFALQLRGYAPSWPFLLLAALAVASHAQGRWRTAPAMAVFAAASLGAVALLPTNLPWLLVMAAIAAALGSAARRAAWWQRLPWLALPMIGLVAYAGVFDQLAGAAAQSWHNPEGRLALLATIYGDMAQDALWLLPVMAIGLQVLWRRKTERHGARLPAAGLGIALLAPLAPLALWLFAPSPPFTRAVVPWWPVMLLAAALVAAEGLRALGDRARAVACAAVLLALIANAAAREIAGWRPWPPYHADKAMQQTLLLHYYRADYRPDAAADVIAGWLREDPAALVWSDRSDFPSLRWHLARRDPDLLSRLHFAPGTEPSQLRDWLAAHPVYLVAASEEQACHMLQRAGTACTARPALIADTGFFKGFRIHADTKH